MSKIMRQIYAEALAAREAEARAVRPARESAQEPASAPGLASHLEWWIRAYQKTGSALLAGAAHDDKP